MKITLEQGKGRQIEEQWSVTLDSGGNENLTPEVVELALRAIVAYGHAPCNVINAVRAWADDMESVTKMD